jgi:hypothetical protein
VRKANAIGGSRAELAVDSSQCSLNVQQWEEECKNGEKRPHWSRTRMLFLRGPFMMEAPLHKLAQFPNRTFTFTFLEHSCFSLAIASLSAGSCFWVTAFYSVTFCLLGTEKPEDCSKTRRQCLAITFIVTFYCYMLTSSLHGVATTSQ